MDIHFKMELDCNFVDREEIAIYNVSTPYNRFISGESFLSCHVAAHQYQAESGLAGSGGAVIIQQLHGGLMPPAFETMGMERCQ
jgi:hypothetical protein